MEFYGEIGDVTEAKKLFDDGIDDKDKDVVTLGTMIKCLMNNNCNHEAIQTYDKFQNITNDTNNLLVLKACMNVNNFNKGDRIINDILNDILKTNTNPSIQLLNTMIDFYGHFKYLQLAQQTFDQINENKKDIITINSFMNCCINNGNHQKALDVYDEYIDKLIGDGYNKQQKGLLDVTFILALNACIEAHDYERGLSIHSKIPLSLFNIVNVGNVLIEFYSKFRKNEKAEQIFKEISDQIKDAITINTMMKMYLNNRDYAKILHVYDKYRYLADRVSHFTAIKACILSENMRKGAEIHMSIDFDPNDLAMKSTLVEFYGHFRKIDMAQQIFDSIDEDLHNNVTVNCMMKAYLENEHYKRIISLYKKYPSLIDDVSHINAIHASIHTNNYEFGKKIHEKIGKNDQFLSLELKNALIDFYGNFRNIHVAKSLFTSIQMKDNDVISVNTMMNAYSINEMHTECIDLFYDIYNRKINDLTPDSISFIIALKSCAESAAYHHGLDIINILKRNYPQYESEKSVNINMINFHGRCGNMDKAEDVFNEYLLNVKKNNESMVEVEIYHAMLKAYGRNGISNKAGEIFSYLQRNKMVNERTYKLLITAYSHCGDMDHIEEIWINDIKSNDEFRNDSYIIASLIDAFAKHGELEKAMNILNEYEMNTDNEFDEAMYMCLLNGCRMFNNDKMANQVYDRMNEITFSNDLDHITMNS